MSMQVAVLLIVAAFLAVCGITGEVVEKRQTEAHRRSGKEKKDEAGYHWKEP